MIHCITFLFSLAVVPPVARIEWLAFSIAFYINVFTVCKHERVGSLILQYVCMSATH
jgi:hypothetical protein